MLDLRHNRRQRDRFGIDLQRPGDRAARLLDTAHAHQPMGRFRDPGTDVKCQQGRQQANREQSAPADIGGRVGPEKRPQQHARRQHRRGQAGQPAALMGRHEFLHQRDVHRIQPGHAEADDETADDQIEPRPGWRKRHRTGGEREVQHGQDHNLAAADLVRQPAIEQRSERRADAGRQQDHSRLSVGQVPTFDDKRKNKPDQEEVEEIEHVAERRGNGNLPLICGQLLLPIEQFEHGGASL